jgi:hypothetical protein
MAPSAAVTHATVVPKAKRTSARDPGRSLGKQALRFNRQPKADEQERFALRRPSARRFGDVGAKPPDPL